MKFLYLFIILLFVSCSDKKNITTKEKTQYLEEINTGFDPAKSKKYKDVDIEILFKQNKDTFLIGESLTAQIYLSKNIEMLKSIANHQNLQYKIEYDVGGMNKNKSLKIIPSVDNKYADINFNVKVDSSTINRHTNQYQPMEWMFAITFKFLENETTVYDTIFIKSVPYVVKVN